VVVVKARPPPAPLSFLLVLPMLLLLLILPMLMMLLPRLLSVFALPVESRHKIES
jgi:hypothetical protein